MKRRFRIITRESGPEYSKETQVRLVYACTALHNFIVDNEGLDDEQEEDLGIEGEEGEEELIAPQSTSAAAKAMNLRRDKIAEQMWTSYVVYRST